MSEVTVDVEAIPDELKERDQWMVWDRDAERKKPIGVTENGLNHQASWTAPDDWCSFEKAVSAAEGRESVGIGYVFARGNDDHPRGLYGALDLDGCADAEGIPKDWLPSLQPFFDEDAYIERSPSGEGLHIPLVGFEPPEWWSNEHFSENEHEGVEAYASKFFTFTGDRLQGAGDEVAAAGEFVEEWLLEAYTMIVGEMPPELQPTNEQQRAPEKSREEVKDIETTSNTDDVLDAVDHLTPSDLTLSSSFTENESTDWESWDPGYRSSNSGKSLKRHKPSGLFKDFAETDPASCTWFGPLDIFAAEEGIIRRPWDNLDGDDWWDAVDAAREDGAPIPEYDASHHSGPPTPEEYTEQRDEESGEDGDTELSWDYVQSVYEDEGKDWGRYYATKALDDRHSWMYVVESETLWVYDDDTGYYNRWGEQFVANVLERRLGAHYSRSEKDEVLGRLEARHQTHRDELNASTREGYYLCVGNGVVDLSTGELHDHDPSFKFTRGLSWDYDPAKADPEPVVEFLDDVTKREEDRDTLLDHLAHGLMPGHPYRAFVITYGPGSNGKTQMGKLFRGFVGEDNAASVELQDLTGDDQFATGGLPGAFVNVGDDISVSEIRDVSILKSLTGGGTVRANEKYEKQYEFENEAAMFFSANEPPRISEETDAIGDRLYPVEMPYRFVDADAFDPENPRHKKKTPRIAQSLLEDEAAMRGLLLLCVKHAQELIQSNGQYSMPEGPRQRREIYEAASDPIRRFALEHFEQGGQNDLILKDDAFDVYKAMCEMENERVASSQGFKRQISQQALVDLESGKTRQFSSGDGQERCWRYVRFKESAKDLMPARLVERYFPDDESPHDGESGEDGLEGDRPAFGASPISDAAEATTGYVTVTGEVATVQRLGEGGDGAKAILKDVSGAIDIKTWDEDWISRFEDLEDETIVVQSAEVYDDDYDGTRKLAPVEGLTEVKTIQQGVGYTESAAPSSANQGQLDDAAAETASDGGPPDTATTEDDVPDDAEGATADARRIRQTLTAADGPLDEATLSERACRDTALMPSHVDRAVRAAKTKGMIVETPDGRYETS